MRDDLPELLTADPFAPFRIFLASGNTYDIRYKHLVALGKTQLTIYPPKSDKWAMVRLNHIVAIQSVDDDASPRRKRAG